MLLQNQHLVNCLLPESHKVLLCLGTKLPSWYTEPAFCSQTRKQSHIPVDWHMTCCLKWIALPFSIVTIMNTETCPLLVFSLPNTFTYLKSLWNIHMLYAWMTCKPCPLWETVTMWLWQLTDCCCGWLAYVMFVLLLMDASWCSMFTLAVGTVCPALNLSVVASPFHFRASICGATWWQNGWFQWAL